MDQAEQVRRYRLLLQAAGRIGSVMGLEDLIDQILDRAQDVIQAEVCSLLLPDPRTGELILFSTSSNIRSLEKSPRVPSGMGVAGEVFRARKAVNVKDAAQDPRHYPAIEREVGFRTRAMLTIPLLEGERCLGVMQALNPLESEQFSKNCLEIFEAFGVLVVSALLRLEAQARTFEEIQTRQELSLAKEIQESFLPRPEQRFEPCQVHLRSFPAHNVGGDFYFLHQLDANRFLMGLGDVAGKGVPAALTMARATAMIKAMAGQLHRRLSQWVRSLNQQICQEISAGRFIGITFLLADAAENTLQICCAGQFPPLHLAEGRWSIHSPQRQPPLGIFPSFAYEAETSPLNRGDLWLLYSDGMTEARNNSGDEFTQEQFLHSLPADQTSTTVFAKAIEAWRQFVGNADQHDDASLLLLDWRGLSPPEHLELTCAPDTLCSARHFVESWAKHAGYDDTTVGQLVLACDEAASNIFRHGYQTRPGPLWFHARIKDRFFLIDIRDQAEPVQAGQIKGRDLADLRPGGLGTVILRKTFDTVEYEPLVEGNRVRLRKQLPD